MDAPVYNQEGKKVSSVTLPNELFGAPWNPDLVHQVTTSMFSNKRANTAHTKGRDEVRGGGKKPWRQKGTGRARHGSRRSPIWVGGGITHGPRNERDYTKQIPRGMRVAALRSVLSKKFKDGEVVFVDALAVGGKTREAKGAILGLAHIKGFETLGTKRKNALLVTVPEKSVAVARAFQNMGNVLVETGLDLNILSLLKHRFCAIVDPSTTVSLLQKRTAKKEAKKVMKETK